MKDIGGIIRAVSLLALAGTSCQALPGATGALEGAAPAPPPAFEVVASPAPSPALVPSSPLGAGGEDGAVPASPSIGPGLSVPWAIWEQPIGTVYPITVLGRCLKDLDIVIFERARATQLELPGLNTAANEFNPRLVVGGRQLYYVTDARGQLDIYCYDLRAQLVDPLPWLNTCHNDAQPRVSADGIWLVYTERVGDKRLLRRYNTRTRQVEVPAATALAELDVLAPSLSPDGRWVIFSTPTPDQLDLMIYDFARGALLSVPHLNSIGSESSPLFDPTGRRVLFLSDRSGTFDLFLLDLATGFVECLNLANSGALEYQPSWVSRDEILFSSTRAPGVACFAYNLKSHMLDTLPTCGQAGVRGSVGPLVTPPP